MTYLVETYSMSQWLQQYFFGPHDNFQALLISVKAKDEQIFTSIWIDNDEIQSVHFYKHIN